MTHREHIEEAERLFKLASQRASASNVATTELLMANYHANVALYKLSNYKLLEDSKARLPK